MPRKCQICHVVGHDEQRLVMNFHDRDFVVAAALLAAISTQT